MTKTELAALTTGDRVVVTPHGRERTCWAESKRRPMVTLSSSLVSRRIVTVRQAVRHQFGNIPLSFIQSTVQPNHSSPKRPFHGVN